MLSCINNQNCTDCMDINSDDATDVLDTVHLVNVILKR